MAASRCFQCDAPVEPHYKACPACGTTLSDFMRTNSDRPIDGKYELIEQLGVGGMGEVYKARHVHLDSIRVIKLMRPAIAGTAGAHERFVREAKLATRIQHPNVATLHDFATLPDGTYYMVWEFIDGTNLAARIKERGSLSPREVAQISIEALRGLQAIHDAGVVHRDISPENVMLTSARGAEHVKIIDLGIAKPGDGTSKATETGMFVGKWKYCSPEHLGLLEEGEHIDGRADLYSFGIVMYEMLAGRPPFEAETPHQYVVLHTREAPKKLELHGLGVPELEAVLLRALEKDRNRRFASAGEMADALTALLPRLADTPLPESAGAATLIEQAPTVTATPPRATSLPSTVVEPGAALPPPGTPTAQTAAFVSPATLDGYKQKLGPKIAAFFRTPVGKLTAVVLFLGFVALVLPTVVVIIKWTLIAAFCLFALVASWKVYQWYRTKN